MSTYTLLRNNRQFGPYTLDEIAKMGLKTHDLVWIEGKSASWRYPTEIEELKSLVPKPAEKSYNHIPLSRTRLQNDFLLLRNDNQQRVSPAPVLSDTELAEFPTLARFFMADQYEKQNTASTAVAQQDSNKVLVSPVKKSVWVSMPSTVKGKNIVLINNGEVRPKKELRPILPPQESLPAPELLSEEMEMVSERVSVQDKVSVIPVYEEIQQQPINESNQPPAIPEVVYAEHKDVPAHVEQQQTVSTETPVFFMHRKDKRRYASSLLQNLAIAVAIASLLTVGGLIAYSVLYPDYPSVPATVKSDRSAEKITGKSKNLSVPAMATETAFRTETDQGPPFPADNSTSPSGQLTDGQLNSSQVKTKKPAEKKADKRTEEFSAKETENNSATGEEQMTAVANPVEPVKAEEKKNIAEFVDLRLDGYKVGLLGGVKEFDVVIKNNADVPLDLVVVELRYIQSNKKVYKTETLEFYDIAAQSHQSIEVPRSSRGVKVETQIKSIASREYGLGFNN